MDDYWKCPFIKKEAIWEQADSFRLKGEAFPVDIDLIVEKLNIDILPDENISMNNALAFLSRDRQIIYVDGKKYNDPRFDNPMRFAIAHELGHFTLHKDFYENTNFHQLKST